ncbi:MAG: Sua5/YciO/YrdC/YwlC family protein [Sulfurimonadaceae bacterium]
MHQVILAQTDTTVGFLSQDAQKLASIKERPSDKPFIQSFDSLKSFSQMGGRVPNRHKSRLRRSKSTTYVINNSAVRIVSDGQHHQLLSKYGWVYSTSANEKGKSFEREFAEKHADIIIEDSRGLYEGQASAIYKLNHQKIKQLR